jgi:hypothetical protein
VNLKRSLETSLYLHQKRKDQGFPSSEKRSSGSKLDFFLAIERLKMAAGLPNENVGIREMPLLVTSTDPDSLVLFTALSVCERATSGSRNSTNMSLL